MATSRPEISMIRGDTLTLRLTVTDDDSELFDLTGSTLHFRVKQKVTDADPALIIKSSALATEIEILLPQTDITKKGRADIKLGPSDTDSLTPGNYVYDVWIVLSTGAEHVVIKPSRFRIEQAVTEL